MHHYQLLFKRLKEFNDVRYHNSKILKKQVAALITIRRRLISWFADCNVL